MGTRLLPAAALRTVPGRRLANRPVRSAAKSRAPRRATRPRRRSPSYRTGSRPSTTPRKEPTWWYAEEEHDAAEHAEVARAEHDRDQRVGRRHRRQPQNADDDREHDHRGRAGRNQQKGGEGHRARDVNQRQKYRFGIALADDPGGQRADDIEKSDQADRHHRPARGDAEVA